MLTLLYSNYQKNILFKYNNDGDYLILKELPKLDLVTVYDNEYADTLNGFLLTTGESFTFRGLTNVAQVSAIAASAGNIHFRAQYFSFNPSR